MDFWTIWNLELPNSNSSAIKRVKPMFGQDEISKRDSNTQKLTFKYVVTFQQSAKMQKEDFYIISFSV